MLKLDWGDAQVWMDTAEALYACARDNSSRARIAGYPQTNELNVAVVCAGYAFELIFKVLVRAADELPAAVHQPSKAYAKLQQEDKAEVDRIVGQHGWKNSADLLAFLDEQLCHKYRKYWMRPPRGGQANAAFSVGGRKGIDALKKLHKDLSELAIKRIQENARVYEHWPGADRHSP